jgi:Ni/Fe-hydrogenase b-type cytochrome subunit
MKKIYLHPLPVRVWHWINAASFLILIITGLQIRYRDIMHLLSFRTAVDIHNIFGFVLLFNYLLWVLYYILSSKLDIYMPAWSIREFIEGSIRQARYYSYGIFRGEQNPHHPTPESKFNPMQQVAYLNIMTFLLPLQIVTGFMLWNEKAFAKWIAFFGGIRVVDSIHVLLFLFFTSFLFVHIYLATLGHTPLAHIKAMFTGYEKEEGSHAHH